MTRTLEDRNGLSAPDLKVLEDIQGVGWHVTGVFPQKASDGPEWAFSIGLFRSFGHPEVMILGLPLQTCMNIVNVIGEEVKAGKSFNPGNSYADILQDPFKCAFQAVDRQFYRDYVGYALWFYENDRFPLVQCFWPDKEQRLPWDSGCDEYVKNSQPMLSGTSRLC